MRKLVVICGLVAQKSSAALLAIMLCAAMVMPGPAEAYRDTPTPGNQPSTAPTPSTKPPMATPPTTWVPASPTAIKPHPVACVQSQTFSQDALGATLTPVHHGLRIGMVDPYGPFARVGIEPDDIITEVQYNGFWTPTYSVPQLHDAINNLKSVGGSYLQIKVWDHRTSHVYFFTVQV